MTEVVKYKKLISRYSDPMKYTRAFESQFMVLWPVPMWIDTHIPALPNKIYINKDIVKVFEDTMNALVSNGCYKEIMTFDGMFNVRYIRGSKTKLSIHSWGLAIDLNAAHNPLGHTKDMCIAKGLTPFSNEFDNTFRNLGWTCGIDFSRADGMHFEYTKHL
jgi:hypothetical protein